MKTVIDNLISTIGWSASDGASIYGLTGNPDYAAGNNSTSLIIKFDGVNSYVEKTYSEDISDYDEIILWIQSRSLGRKNYRNINDYSYKIDFGNDDTSYYLPVNNEFYYIRIKADFDTIIRMRITALTATTDYLILSYFIGTKTILPLDIFQGIKKQIEYYRDNYVTLKTIGTIDGTTDDRFITFSTPVPYLDRYAVIKIDDGVNSEIHGIISKEGNKYTFSQAYDGDKLLNDYDDVVVYLYYPIEFGTSEKDIVFPAITIWGFTPERMLITNELDHIVDSVKTSDDTYQERQVGQYLNWLLMIDCTCKEEWEVLGELSKIVRNVIGKKIVWVNGRKCYINFEAPPVMKEPTDSYDIIPEVQYNAYIEVREELFEEQTLYKTTSINLDVFPTEQGEI